MRMEYYEIFTCNQNTKVNPKIKHSVHLPYNKFSLNFFFFTSNEELLYISKTENHITFSVPILRRSEVLKKLYCVLIHYLKTSVVQVGLVTA